MNKETTQIMKGLAILSIALHNFLHLDVFGFTPENEMSFNVENTLMFWKHLQNPSFAIFFDFLSFLGWFGVPIFVFLSGFGLYKKYENNNINIRKYIKHSYIKLFVLLLPAALFFICYQVLSGLWKRVLFSFFSLTFLNGLFDLPSSAPTFWYFSLTFQLYIIYILLYKLKNNHQYFIIIICLIVQYLTQFVDNQNQDFLSYLRHNFYGWLPIFILGILIARMGCDIKLKSSIATFLLILFVLFLTIVMNFNFVTWLLMPFVAILLFFLLSLLIESNSFLKNIGVELGHYSPFIFVSHPIAMVIMKEFELVGNVFFQTILYVLLFAAISFFYKIIDQYLIGKITY